MKTIEVEDMRQFIQFAEVRMIRYALIGSSRLDDDEEAISVTAFDAEKKEIIKFDVKKYFSQSSEPTRSSISSFEMKQMLAFFGIQSDYGEWGPNSAQWHLHLRKALDI